MSLNTTTYTKILSADKSRLGYKISNDSPHDILVKELAFDDPDSTTDIGFIVFKRSLYESQQDLYPIGEISAKAVTGTPAIRVVGM